jgi:hypothetical protein
MSAMKSTSASETACRPPSRICSATFSRTPRFRSVPRAPDIFEWTRLFALSEQREPDSAQRVCPAAPRDRRLDDIDRSIAKTRELNPNRLALVLNVARLELKTQIYSVSDDELRMLSMATR